VLLAPGASSILIIFKKLSNPKEQENLLKKYDPTHASLVCFYLSCGFSCWNFTLLDRI
jgi:hypothetical protein